MKKILAVILTSAILASIVMTMGMVTAFAADNTIISVGSADAAPGDTVSVDVSIADCSEYSSFTIHISYDSEYVTCDSVSKGIKTDLFMPNTSVKDKKVVAVVGGSVKNITENGVLGTIVFKISDSYPGGVTKVPLHIEKHDITKFDGSKDNPIPSTSLDGEIVISGAGNIVWNDNGTEHDLIPEILTEEEAKEYKNPLNGETPTAGQYYVNKEEKIAVPASTAEENITTQPDAWKTASEEEPSSESSGESENENDEPADVDDTEENGFVAFVKSYWYFLAGGLAVVAAVIVVLIVLNKKKA